MAKKHTLFHIFSVFFVYFAIFMPLSAQAITIIPPRIELSADPGKTISNSVKIYNEMGSVLTLYTSTANFTAKNGKEGVPEFLSPEDSAYGLASWILIEKGPIIILPSEYKSIDYSISIPQNADPGGHYAGIFFQNGNPEDRSDKPAIGLSSKAGTLVLLEVSGNIIESGELKSFGIKNGKKFFEHLPIEFSVGFGNTGNVHLRPEGSIEITNMFGKTVAKIDVNKRKIGAGANILPKTTRHFEEPWGASENISSGSELGFWDKIKFEQNNFALGRYAAKLNLAYGNKNQTIEKTIEFWIFPWQLMLVYLFKAAFLILALIFLVRKYNRWIVKKAMKKYK